MNYLKTIDFLYVNAISTTRHFFLVLEGILAIHTYFKQVQQHA